MHIINFFIALLIPWLSLLGFFGPTSNFVPVYFANQEAGLMAAIFGSICGFWLGFLRNFVGYNGKISDTSYHKILWSLLLLFIFTKIMYAVPHMWFSGIVDFILGVFAVPGGQTVSKGSIWFISLISLITFGYLGFLLTEFAWFGYNSSKFYYYIFLGVEYLKDFM